jgi:serine/threonine protein phosphatase 1
MPMVVTMLTCFVGDLGSRTEQSGVIQTTIDGQNAGNRWHCILGNDLMFHQFVTTATVLHPEILSSKTMVAPPS